MPGMPTVENRHGKTQAVLQRTDADADGSDDNICKTSELVNAEPTAEDTWEEKCAHYRGDANNYQNHNLQTRSKKTQRQAETNRRYQRENNDDGNGLQRRQGNTPTQAAQQMEIHGNDAEGNLELSHAGGNTDDYGQSSESTAMRPADHVETYVARTKNKKTIQE